MAALAALLLASGCNCGPPAGVQDAGTHDAATPPQDAGTPIPDAGVEPKKDAGPVVPPPPYQAGEACPEDEDGGAPDAHVRFGVCVALRKLSGTALHNGAPITAPFTLQLVGTSGYQSDYAGTAEANGHYEVAVLKSRYEQTLYQPSEIFPTHQGLMDFGVADLTQDRTKDLSVRSAQLSGKALWGGVPWKSLASPLDTTVVAGGNPSQAAAVRSQAGSYQVRLMEGTFFTGVSVPREALGDTALSGYPVDVFSVFDKDRVLDIDLPVTELNGSFTIDGQPFPDRVNGAYDYSLTYSVAGVPAPVVETFHEAGVAPFKATLPKNVYNVSLELVDRTDAVYPSSLYNFQVASGLDLSAPQPTLSVGLSTWKLEGTVGIDGMPAQAAPNTKFWFYAYAYQNLGGRDWFLSYYTVPSTSSTFSVRAFPATYYLALYLDSSVQPELAEGWFVVDRQLAVNKDLSVPIDISTTLLEGTLSIDGVPASAAQYSGTLTFIPTASSDQQGTYRYRVRTDDGTFRVRLPRARYEVYFEVNPQAYPEHASGRQRVQVELDGSGPISRMDAQYVTRRVTGPLRVGGAPLPDSRGVLPEATLELNRAVDHVIFRKALDGGQGTYSLRVPPGEYTVTFHLEKDALPRTAWGDAPLGGPRLLVK